MHFAMGNYCQILGGVDNNISCKNNDIAEIHGINCGWLSFFLTSGLPVMRSENELESYFE